MFFWDDLFFWLPWEFVTSWKAWLFIAAIVCAAAAFVAPMGDLGMVGLLAVAAALLGGWIYLLVPDNPDRR